MSEIEQKVRSALLQTALWVAVAVISLVLTLVYSFWLRNLPMKSVLVVGGASMAIASLIAQHRHKYFVALLTPNTFATPEFVNALLKYRKYKSVGGWLFLALSVLGVLLGVFGAIYASSP
jgi:hypothetical protein